MKIFFLDQSGDPGGAELCLIDIALLYRENCLVGLFADGAFKYLLEENNIPVMVLSSKAIQVRKDSNLLQGLSSLFQMIPLIIQTFHFSRHFDLIYANTPKALIIGSVVSYLRQRPLVYHLHDILSDDHFSWINRRLAVVIANHFASLIIANSKATTKAFNEAGGSSTLIKVVYNGFKPEIYQHIQEDDVIPLRRELEFDGQFIVGHFSRLGPWKGQHILLEALLYCPENITAIFVGGAFFGVENYVQKLHHKVKELKLKHRVKFLGFRSDTPQLMSACNLITHTSIAPEPFGRVIVEAMLCNKPVIAADAGGAAEIIEHDKTGWLTPPGDAHQLAKMICQCHDSPEHTSAVTKAAKEYATQQFNLPRINQEIDRLLNQVIKS
jgi:glycosyltransferase involved in cell wall biosynthesis